MNSNVKERRTRILLTLFLLGKEKAHHIFDTRIQHIFSLPADSPRSRGTLRQMLQDEIINKEETGFYKINEQGLYELALSFPFVRFNASDWDGKFRILSYEIPESKRKLRDSLRREVSGWGLGPWHRSFWLTPHPVIDNLKKLTTGTDWQGYVQAFEGVPVVGESRILLEKVWGLSKLEVLYKKLFKDWHSALSAEKSTKDDKLKIIVAAYIETLKVDPGLPVALVQERWIGFEAFNIFQEMRKVLLY